MTMTAAEIKKHRDELKTEKGGEGKNLYWSLKKPGDAYIRIGRPWVKNGEIWKELIVHKIWKGGTALKVYCAKNTGGKCPVCRRRKKLESEGRNTYTKKLFGICSPNIEAYWNVLVAKTEEDSNGKIRVKGYEDKKFKIMQLSKAAHGEILDIFSEPEYRALSPLGVASHKEGYLIRIRREGEGIDTVYKFRVMGKPCPLSKDPDKLAAYGKTLNDLDKLGKSSSEEELRSFVHEAEKTAKKWAKSQEQDSGGDDEEFDDDDENLDDED